MFPSCGCRALSNLVNVVLLSAAMACTQRAAEPAFNGPPAPTASAVTSNDTAPAVAPGAPTPAPSASLALGPSLSQRLTPKLEELMRPSGGRLGLAVQGVESGATFQLNGAETFPMASVYKLPIALTVLAKVDRGELTLERTVSLSQADVSVYHSPIAVDLLKSPRGKALPFSIAALLEALLVTSDNTASDVLLARVGGPTAVMAHLQTLRLSGIRVDRSELDMAADALERARPGSLPKRSRQAVEKLEASLSPAERDAVWQAYHAESRDTASPAALVTLLVRLQKGELLSAQSTTLLRQWMERAPQRLGKTLPPGTVVAHKTGTGLGSFNDVGLVTLPDGSHLAIAVLTKNAKGLSLEQGVDLVASIGRAVYDEVLR